MLRTCITLLVLVANAYAVAPAGRAELITIGTTSEWDGDWALGNLRPGEVWGQTFVSPPGRMSQIDTLSLWATPYGAGGIFPPSYTFDVTAYIASWDGEKATAPFLAQSTKTFTAKTWEMNRLDFSFSTPPLLSPDQTYIAFFQLDGAAEIAFANFGYVKGNPYPFGQFVAPYAQSFAYVTSRAWGWPPSGDDFAFEITAHVVPEPTSILMALVGAIFCVITPLMRRIRLAA